MKDYEGFLGSIGRTLADSTPHWPERAHPGETAPNVIFILFDDLGFSHFGCYGSSVSTPNIDSLASSGLRYTNFHVTPLCSPTRASLLTGRNHHAVGMRGVSNFSTGFPHMRGHISNHAATIAEVLRDEGYATFALGKWHLCPMSDASAAGPFDQWPLQRGFDRYYGFLDGETDQFHPDLIHDNHSVEPPARPEDGYHLTEDLVDKAIGFLHDSISIRPDRPFFMYFALGATHAPHQAPQKYLDKYKGAFDEGWDVIRERWFENQKRLGVIPPETRLAPRNPGVEPWNDLSENQQRLACRLQETFAGFLDHTDEQIGRLMTALQDLEVMDNTIVVLLADNGASQEGGPFGVLHEMKFFNFVIETPDEAISRVDDIGGHRSHANYPWGWAQAGNTPFKWYKQNVHEGGVHVPLVIHWPERIRAGGELRHQFHHVNDLVPTIYDILDITPPSTYRGFEQMPVSGVSLAYTFDQPDEPSHKRVQYFEMVGHRGIYCDGWKAVTKHQPGTSFDDDVWELYHVAQDRSETIDLAEVESDRLADLIELWWEEAEREGVLPLDDRGVELFGARFEDRTVHPRSRRYVYRPPMSPLPAQVSASIGGRSWNLTAHVRCQAGDEGVLYATGTENSGLSVYVLDQRLVFDYNCFGEHHIVHSAKEVPHGESKVGVEFRRDGRQGRATLTIDGDPCGELHVPFVMRMMSSVGASIGYDHGSPVGVEYAHRQDGFGFTGHLHQVVVELVSVTPEGERLVSEANERSTMGRQ